jgi:hypothetical protein
MKLEDKSIGTTLTRRRMSQSALTDRVPVSEEIEFFRNISCCRLSLPNWPSPAANRMISEVNRFRNIRRADTEAMEKRKWAEENRLSLKHPFHPDET